MFGKKYEKDILDVKKRINEVVELVNKNQKAIFDMVKDQNKIIDGFQNSLIQIAIVQKSHKEAIEKISKML